MDKQKIIEETIRKISSRVKELLKKVEKKTWNNATLYAFQIGLSLDVEESINKIDAKRKYWELKYKKLFERL